jgi:hypothetical protein
MMDMSIKDRIRYQKTKIDKQLHWILVNIIPCHKLGEPFS